MPEYDDRDADIPSGDKSPSDEQEINWKVVAKTAGLMPAEIIAGRLQSEGISARAWQEGAGQALGLTVGLLGNGYVVVPEEDVDRAEEILKQSEETDIIDDYNEE